MILVGKVLDLVGARFNDGNGSIQHVDGAVVVEIITTLGKKEFTIRSKR